MIRHGPFRVATAISNLWGKQACIVITANPMVLEDEKCEKAELDPVYQTSGSYTAISSESPDGHACTSTGRTDIAVAQADFLKKRSEALVEQFAPNTEEPKNFRCRMMEALG